MKTIKLSLCLLAALLASHFAFANLTGPYTVDANTLYLFHFDEAAGGTLATNVGSKGGVSYSVNESPASATPPTVTTMLGATGYSTNSPTSISFNNCMTNPTLGYVFGYDFNKSGAYQGEGTAPAGDAMAMTNFNMGNGGKTPFTLEALIQPSTTAGTQEIITTDSSAGSRGFQFRINGGGLNFQCISISQSVSGTIPTTGSDAFVPGAWYHVAVTYDGTNAILYWTRLDPSVGAAHLLNSAGLTISNTFGTVAGTLNFGCDNRAVANEQFLGSIDEIRISNVARAANQMQFFSPLVTITQNPVSQNIDYNSKVTFSVGASSTTALGYQWRFNSNSIAGATNSSYVITNTAAANAGYYDVIVTNALGNSATSSPPALLVVGAANFLNHRYSFTTDTSDSIGGATGTNFGTATVTGGQLVLDGSSGCYMQLPSNFFTAANSTALTVEFWATYGVNANNVHVFDFGSVNTAAIINSINYVGFSPHNAAAGQQIDISPGDESFQQTVTNAGTLDGLTVHVACVIDPPNQTLAIYTNGVLEAVNNNMTVGIASLNDAFSYIGRSLDPSFPYLNASIDELRIYNGALAALSIKQSDSQGPNTVLADGPAVFTIQPTNTSTAATLPATFTAAAVGYLPISYQWFKNGALVPGATNTTYTFIASAGDNNASILCYATNTIGVTTYVTNSATATLSVVNPPTLVWLGQNSDAWDTSTLNWTNTGTALLVSYDLLDGALFNDLGVGQPTVDLTQSVNPLSVTVDSAAVNYTFISSGVNGSLTGGGSLTKNNTDTFIIDVPDTMTGPVLISGGLLQIGNNDSLGTLGSGPVTNNATLSLDRSDATLTVANVIHGSGTLSIDGTGSVTISGASDFTGPTLVNQGILNLQNGTGLGATNGSITVSSANNAELYITANVDVGAKPLIIGGTGVASAGALRKGGAGATTYSGPVTLTDITLFSVDGGATLNLTNGAGVTAVSDLNLGLTGTGAGNITGPISLGAGNLIVSGGTWTVAPSNNFSGATINGGQMKITGSLSAGPVPGSPNAGQVTLNGGTLGCATNVTLNDGNIGITLTANSSISADANTTLIISNQISSSSASYSLTKTGTGKVVLNGANPFNGTLDVDTAQGSTGNDGTLVIASSAAIANLLVLSGTPEIQVRNQNAATSTLGLDGTSGGVTINPDINMNGRNNAVPAIDNIAGNNTIAGGITIGTGGGTYALQSDSGTLTLTAPLPFATPTSSPRTFTFTGAGNITASGGVQNGSSGIAINVIKSGTGTLTLPVANTYNGSTTINNGVLMLNGSITSTGSVLVASGAAATLSGTGSITDNVTAQSGGTISPGAGANSIGVFTISGNLTNNGTLLMDLSKSGPVLTNDTIIGVGTLQYGGTLQLVLNGSPLASGDSFTLFSAGSRVGAFTNIVPTTPGSGLAWNTNALGTSGVLSVMVGTAPLSGLQFTGKPVISGTSLTISGTNTGAGSFYLLSSTNVAAPLGTWTPVWTNTAGGSGSFTTNLNVVNPALGRQFYIFSTTNNH